MKINNVSNPDPRPPEGPASLTEPENWMNGRLENVITHSVSGANAVSIDIRKPVRPVPTKNRTRFIFDRINLLCHGNSPLLFIEKAA